MKLFVTNKDLLCNVIENHNEENKESLNSFQVHQKAFNELQTSIVSIDAIPINITVAVDKDYNFIILEFKNKKGDVYFYEYKQQ